VLAGLPQLSGSPVCVYARPELTAHRGKLRAGAEGHGTEVYAASFIRKREIILSEELFEDLRLLRLIVIHELFHFVWTRLGNRARNEFHDLLAREIQRGARGELGESADVSKRAFRLRSQPEFRSRLWREYACESFCDTAAWMYSGVREWGEYRLAKRWRAPREEWFRKVFTGCWSC